MNDDTPFGEVRKWLRERTKDGKATPCPCCTQTVKIYPWTLPNATAHVMIRLWRLDEGIDHLPAACREPDDTDPTARQWTFLPKMLDRMTGTPAQGGYGVLGWHWGLLEQRAGLRPDGSNRVGWWRLTDLGHNFVLGDIKVSKRAHIFNNRCLSFSGPDWTIRDALGTRFDYDELMGHKP